MSSDSPRYKRLNERGCKGCKHRGDCVIPDNGVENCALRHKEACNCIVCIRARRGTRKW